MRYFTYDDETGEITGAYIQDLHPYHGAGNWIEVTEEQYAQRHELVVVDGELQAKPAPDPAVVLAQQRDQVWERIKAYRERLSDTGGYEVTVGGVTKWFHSDLKSKTQQIALVVAGAGVPAVPWKTMDGTFVTMSQAWAVAIFAAASAQEAAIFATAEAHRGAVMASAEPLAYDWTGGWPAVYGGA